MLSMNTRSEQLPVCSTGDRKQPVVYLHVGGPKTGTTYLQEMLWRNRTSLLRQGVLYPGARPDAHFRAAQDVLCKPFNGYADPATSGTWRELVDEAKKHDGTSVVSHELLSLASNEDVERALNDLTFAEVHVVYSARDLARQIPSVWQEDLKNGHALMFEDFVKGVRGDEQFRHWLVDLFWKFQNSAQVLATWGRNFPKERVHLITVPPRGSASGLLWERFAKTIGVEPAACTYGASMTNHSLGTAEANLLRHVNLRLASDLDWTTYEELVKGAVVGALAKAANSSSPISLPESEYGWVVERSKQLVMDLREANYSVVGDLEELLPARVATDDLSRHPDDASEAEQLDAATDAMVGLARSLREARLPAMRRHSPPEPDAIAHIKRGVQLLSERNRFVMVLRRLYRMVKRGFVATGLSYVAYSSRSRRES